MQRRIIWSEDASNDLIMIIERIKEKSGSSIARSIYEKLTKAVENIDVFPDRGRVIPELASIGILSIREIIESPWRIAYRKEERDIYVLSVIDGRRNVEDILYTKVIDGKIK